ncbi:DNA repair protein complementing XP-C cells-like isoform X2 [Stegodyphus dumicola]|nr:DNA repair protein complementing XP-C cells-like isoform X2 [Stegodyphus dumicola]XP_035204500.1 DNA repair protein complementing XP-C cells-like isoform X2 [Stegodyphus dumicola]XP_035204501.1 DNA repair protein complementing XP-C cells-like isoform X2 [Stegodyphus dumicola]
MAPSTRKRKVTEDKLIVVQKKRNQKEKSNLLDHSQSKSKRKTSVEDEIYNDSSETTEKSANKKPKNEKGSKHVAVKATPEVKEAKLVLSKVKVKQEERGSELYDNETVKKSSINKLSKNVKSSKRVVSETLPELKEAKVLLSKVKVKQEESDSELEGNSRHSTDSGIVSELSDVKDKSSFSVNCKSDLSMQSSSYLKEEGKNEASSSESEWEEVEEREEQSLDDYNPVIPKEGVEITIDCPDLHIRKRKKKQFDWHEYIRLYINRERKDAQLCLHKTHLLCLLAHGFFVNDVLNSTVLKGMALSLIPDDIFASFSGKKVDKIDINGVENLVSWFNSSFSVENETNAFINLRYNMVKNFERKKSLNASEYNLMFIVIARTLGFKARFCVSFYPITYKAQNLLKKPQSKERSTCKKKVKTEKCTVSASSSSSANKGRSSRTADKTPKIQKAKTETKRSEVKKGKTEKMNRPERSKKKSYKISSDEDDDDDRDKDFKVEDKKSSDEDTDIKKKNPRHSRGSFKTPNRKVLSSDSEPVSPVQTGYDCDKITCWAEVFSKSDKQWVSVDCVNKIINKPYDIEKTIPQPVTYILAYDNSSNVKDVTRRYCAEYMTCTLKLRVDPDWWEETLEPFLPPNTKLDKEEEKKLDMVLSNKPLPTTVAG